MTQTKAAAALQHIYWTVFGSKKQPGKSHQQEVWKRRDHIQHGKRV